MNRTLTFLDHLSRLARWAAMAILIVMTVIIGWQVFGRFILNDTPAWSEQLATSLMVWIALLGGAVVAREDRHIALTFFLNLLPPAIARLVRLAMQVLILAFALMMLWYGTQMSLIVKNWTIPTLGVSRALDYVAFPVAGLLIALFALSQLRGALTRKQAQETPGTEAEGPKTQDSPS